MLNYPGEQGEVLCNLLICGSRIIACDICKAEMDGFMQGMEMPTPTLEQSPQEGQAQTGAQVQTSQTPVSDGAQAQQAQAGAEASQTAQTQAQPAAAS